MKKLPANNKNLIKFYGTYRDHGRLVIVTEFVKNGSLDIYIQIHKERILKGKRVFQRLLNMAIGICDGMRWLEAHHILHCDLACRNCLVGAGEVIKICDFGLSKITSNNIYQADPNKLFPVKWSAPEVLGQKRFSNKSDVWSFGCCMYEIFSFGKIPYGFKTDDLVAQDRIIAGKLPGKRPPNCPPSLYRKVFLKAWKKRAQDRPSFKQMKKMLKRFRH